MRADGIDVISFGAGEPDFNTPKPICDGRSKQSTADLPNTLRPPELKELKEGDLRQTQPRKTISATHRPDRGELRTKHSLYNSLQVLVDPAMSHSHCSLLDDLCRSDSSGWWCAKGLFMHRLSPDSCRRLSRLAEAITDRTKAILINSPSNPSGALLPDNVLKGIADLAEKHDLWVIADEIYERLIYGE